MCIFRRRLGRLGETPGFAPPPRDGFALATDLSSTATEPFHGDSTCLLIDDNELARVRTPHHRYHERVATRPPTDDERATLDLGSFTPVLVLSRVTRTTTTPLGSLSLAARPDRFEVDYLIDA
jgi:hypothetical protein